MDNGIPMGRYCLLIIVSIVCNCLWIGIVCVVYWYFLWIGIVYGLVLSMDWYCLWIGIVNELVLSMD